jgi:Icc-related predicted phosphoesterase
MSKVMILGDTHGNGHFLDQVIDLAMERECEYIYQLGDFGYWPHELDGVEFLDTLSAALVEVGIKLIFVDGNHENHEMLRKESKKVKMFGTEFFEIRPNLYWTGRTNTWVHEEVRFAALGGAASIDEDDRVEGVSWWAEEITTKEDVQELVDKIGGRYVDIMLTHDAPTAVEEAYGKRLMFHEKSKNNRYLINDALTVIEPARLFHGHYHYKMHYKYGDTDCTGLSWDGAGIQAVRVISLDKAKLSR